jgi:hypothetical protein
LKKKTTKATKTTKKTKKMPPKDPNITDVSRPGKTAPSASARPLLVTNRPVLANDPMIVDGAKPAEPTAVTAMTHRAGRTIEPVTPSEQSAEAQPAGEVSKPLTDAPELPIDVKDPEPSTPAASKLEPPVVSSQPEPAKPNPKPFDSPAPSVDTITTDDAESTDEDVTVSQAQAAEDLRLQELEKLVDSGTYQVPINALQRKRSRMFVAAMCIVALVLALLLLDALLDANLINLPVNVPHTDFFSDI